MKILIVDDEKPARDRLARMVGELKEHELVGEAVNGLEALGLAQSLEPDIVLLDIRMPGMDGIEAARHIARLDEPPAAKVMARVRQNLAMAAFSRIPPTIGTFRDARSSQCAKASSSALVFSGTPSSRIT